MPTAPVALPRGSMIRARFTRGRRQPSDPAEEPSVLEIEPGELARLFVAPPWLRDAGIVAWLLVGIVLVLVGAVWLLALTNTIVMPVITASLIASVTAPIVALMQRHHLSRTLAAVLVLMLILVIGIALAVVVLGGITSQSHDISVKLHDATNQIARWLKDVGVGNRTADQANSEANSSTSDAGRLLLHGVVHTLSGFASLAVFASFTAISLLFLLKDGPALRAWVERHSGVPPSVAHTITGELLRSLRGYFGGVTIVAAFSAVVVGVGAVVIGAPLPGTIAIVTFLGGYVPYLGAWTAGIFAVLLTLGAQGADGALAMAVIALLANGALQQMVQPFAYGATLNLHPLAVLIVTVGAGALFGMVGLVLAAPVTSAVVRISQRLALARAAAEAEANAAPVPP